MIETKILVCPPRTNKLHNMLQSGVKAPVGGWSKRPVFTIIFKKYCCSMHGAVHECGDADFRRQSTGPSCFHSKWTRFHICSQDIYIKSLLLAPKTYFVFCWLFDSWLRASHLPHILGGQHTQQVRLFARKVVVPAPLPDIGPLQNYEKSEPCAFCAVPHGGNSRARTYDLAVTSPHCFRFVVRTLSSPYQFAEGITAIITLPTIYMSYATLLKWLRRPV